MLIAAALIELRLEDSESIKAKRRVVNAVKDRLRRRYNVSVAEVAEQDDRHEICLGCVAVGVDPRHLRAKLENEISERRAEIARLHDDARRAVRRNQDDISLTLIAQKQQLFEELERAEEELSVVKDQAEEAKGNLVRVEGDLDVRMWTAKDGTEKTDVCVNISGWNDSVLALEKRPAKSAAAPTKAKSDPMEYSDDDNALPF